jgi:hypothetical protein
VDVFLGHDLAVADVELGIGCANSNITFQAGVDGKLVCHRGNGWERQNLG